MDQELGLIINELIQGKELAKQLSPSPSSNQANKILIDAILSTYHKVLTILNQHKEERVVGINSPHSSFSNGSPRSKVVMDQDSNHEPPSKKRRKTVARGTEQVKICSKTGLEGSLDDGYNWRKYGQKDILGAKFPRGYYRCTHRNVQGCLATKQVQKSDIDPTITEVTYRGRHTCIQAKNHFNKPIPSKNPKMGLGETHHQQLHKEEKKTETIFTFESEDLDQTNTDDKDIFPWFCYLSPSMGPENEDNNNNNNNILLSETMMENHVMGTFSSESNLFCWSPLNSTGLVENAPTSESDNIADIVSATTSVANSPILDLDMFLNKGDFNTDFPFNTPEYFSS